MTNQYVDAEFEADWFGASLGYCWRPVRTVAPAATPISLTEAKAHLGVTANTDNDLITALISAATDHLDGWSGILGRCLVNQTWRVDLPAWPSTGIRLPFPDVSTIVLKYSDASDVEQTVDGALYQVIDDARSSVLRYRRAFTMPTVYDDRADPVRVTLTAGFGATAASVPQPIRNAILLSVQQLYGMRNAGNVFIRAEEVEGVGRTEYTVSEQAGLVIDRACAALVKPYRRVGW